MDKAYELGQRLERLLYMSVLVIIFSFIVLSLSKSLAISKSVNKTANYQSIIQSLLQNETGINEVRNIESTYQDYIKVEEKRKADFDKQSQESQENRKRNLIVENRVRKSLSLPPIELKKEQYQSIPFPQYNSNLKKINEVRVGVLLPQVQKIDETANSYKDIIIAIINNETNFKQQDVKKIKSVLESNGYDLKKTIEYLSSEIEKEKGRNIKILDIDTPVDFPVSIGSMKLNIPMTNIEGWALKSVPIFLVIWIGSIFITRSFEITQLIESKKIMSFYPHILNLFNIKSKNQSNDKDADVIRRALRGSDEDIKQLRGESVSFGFFRVLILLVMLLSMTIPSYLGFYIYLESDSSAGLITYFTSIIIPAIINIIQILSCVRFEVIASKKTFIIDGETNEII